MWISVLWSRIDLKKMIPWWMYLVVALPLTPETYHLLGGEGTESDQGGSHSFQYRLGERRLMKMALTRMRKSEERR